MQESFLHFIWQYRLYFPGLKTTSGFDVEVVKTGVLNRDAGPDFSNARIKIDRTLWAGNVEIHVRSSDWFHHNHQNDAAYSNIILHVVFEHDKIITGTNDVVIPEVALKGRILDDVYKKYFYYLNNRNWIPCEKDLNQVQPITMKSWMERLFIERLERKTKSHQRLLQHNNNSLSETFYQVLAANFGFKTNDEPFALLSRLLPLSILQKHKNSLFQIEALLFGCAGLLSEDFRDDYPNQLQAEFKFLKKKYSLSQMEPHLWKFLRLRPVNFPTIRIAQFAAIIHKSVHLLSKIIEAESVKDLRSFFDVAASEYWNDHYSFDKQSKLQIKNLGASATDVIILNSVVQMLFFYSKIKGLPEYQDKAIRLMLEMKPESNSILKKWDELGVKAQNAFESQALLELKNSYCKQKKCLQCNVGATLLRTAGENESP
jgi:hypothetical protein